MVILKRIVIFHIQKFSMFWLNFLFEGSWENFFCRDINSLYHPFRMCRGSKCIYCTSKILLKQYIEVKLFFSFFHFFGPMKIWVGLVWKTKKKLLWIFFPPFFFSKWKRYSGCWALQIVLPLFSLTLCNAILFANSIWFFFFFFKTKNK